MQFFSYSIFYKYVEHMNFENIFSKFDNGFYGLNPLNVRMYEV
jgi:hypothetical protein